MLVDNIVVTGLTPDHDQTVTHHGPILRHIGSLPTSGEDSENSSIGNYNFEEEYLLGDNKITIRQYDSTTHRYRERIEFRQESQQTNYYQIDYYETDIQPDDYDMTVNNNILTINLHNKMNNFSNTKGMHPESASRLYYRDSEGNDTYISEKIITKNVWVNEGHIQEDIMQRNI